MKIPMRTWFQAQIAKSGPSQVSSTKCSRWRAGSHPINWRQSYNISTVSQTERSSWMIEKILKPCKSGMRKIVIRHPLLRSSRSTKTHLTQSPMSNVRLGVFWGRYHLPRFYLVSKGAKRSTRLALGKLARLILYHPWRKIGIRYSNALALYPKS